MGPLNESAINSAIDAQFPTRARGVKELCQAIPVIETWGQNTYPDFRLDEIRYAEAGIRSQNYEAKPDWHICQFCDFKTICPSSYAY